MRFPTALNTAASAPLFNAQGTHLKTLPGYLCESLGKYSFDIMKRVGRGQGQWCPITLLAGLVYQDIKIRST